MEAEWWSEWKRSVIAGAGAGCATSLITCPMDVVKTRLQSFFPLNGLNPPSTPKGVGDVKLYKGTVPSLRRIAKEEGIRGLYRGLTPTIVGYLPAHALYFSVYTFSKRSLAFIFPKHTPLNTPQNHILAAMLGGGVAASATNPLWVIRTRLMTQAEGKTPFFYKGTVDAAKKIFHKEGVKGLYKGLGPSLLGLLHVAIQFPLYERLKKRMVTDKVQVNSAPFFGSILLSSSLSKLVASIFTYPHEVLRTRLQSQTEPDSTAKYKGIVHGTKLIWREEGVRGFYRGLGTSIMRVVPASAVTLLTFELIFAALKDS